MNENIKKDYELKCADIKRKLDITDANFSEIDKIKIQPPEITVAAARRSQSPQQPFLAVTQNSNFECTTNSNNSSLNQTTVSANKGDTPLRLEQLLDQHKNPDDFMISWRQLLSLFEIEDPKCNPNTETKCKSVLPQTFDKSSAGTDHRTDHLEVNQRTNHLEVNQSIGTNQKESAKPTTIISVLSVLTALENILGSLGPKLIHLLLTAISMEKSKVNSSNNLLDDNHNCILFETIQEKLKGLLSADLIEANLQDFVKKSIKDMTDLVDQSNERRKMRRVQPPSATSAKEMSLNDMKDLVYQSIERMEKSNIQPLSTPSVEKVSLKVMTDLVSDTIDRMEQSSLQSISTQSAEKRLPRFEAATYVKQLPSTSRNKFVGNSTNERVHQSTVKGKISYLQHSSMQSAKKTLPPPETVTYVESSPEKKSTGNSIFEEGVTLQDSEIKTLMTKFPILSKTDKLNFKTFYNQLKITDPDRVMRLRNEVCQIQNKSVIAETEWEKETYYPNEVFYLDYTKTPAFDVKTTSMAYRVADMNVGVKIKRRKRDESGSFEATM